MARTASKAKIPSEASKEEALKITKEQIRKKYGDVPSCAWATRTPPLDVEVSPRVPLALDAALGIAACPVVVIVRDLRPRVKRQDHALVADRRRSPGPWRSCCFH